MAATVAGRGRAVNGRLAERDAAAFRIEVRALSAAAGGA